MSCDDLADVALRTASLSIAAYDFLMTVPAEVRLFKRQKSIWRPSRPLILFLLIRYLSIGVMVSSNVGFFHHGWSVAECGRFYVVPPIFKVLATTVSSVIVAFRTWALAGRAPWVKYFLSVLIIVVFAVQAFANFWGRIAWRNEFDNCMSGNARTQKIAWIHYLAALIYDFLATAISLFYVVRGETGWRLSGVSRLLFEQGILYFVALTAINVVNLILFNRDNVQQQSAAASMGEAITWIMSQKILIGIHDYYRPTTSSVSASVPVFNLSLRSPPCDPTGLPRAISRRRPLDASHVMFGGSDHGELSVHLHEHTLRKTGASSEGGSELEFDQGSGAPDDWSVAGSRRGSSASCSA